MWRAGVLVLLLPPLWNLAATKQQHARNPVPGEFYTVRGGQMHIACSGAGSPAVVIEAAASASWLAWEGVQQQLSDTTRVCTYDRAGHGWSEPRSGPRDAEAIVAELHELLDAAAVQRPLVLAGHSAGGLYVRAYSRKFPHEVAGVALIDASSPGQLDELPGWRESYEKQRAERNGELWKERLAVWSGWERVRGRCRNEPSPARQHLAGQYNALMCRPAYVGGDESEFMDFETTARQAGLLTTFGRVPLLIISRDAESPTDTRETLDIAVDSVWDREQDAMKNLSPLSWRVVAGGAGHAVHHDRLDLVVRQMTTLVGAVRGGPAPPYGRTVKE